MRYKWLAIPIFLVMGLASAYFYKQLPNELAPLDDRDALRIMITAPEGSTYEYTDRYVSKVANFVGDSLSDKERRLTLGMTAPGFAGTGASNTGFVRLMLTESDKRKRSQQAFAGDQREAGIRLEPSCTQRVELRVRVAK